MNGKRAMVFLLVCTAALMGPALASSASSPVCVPATRELFRLRVVNDAGGAVSVSRDGGDTWQLLGEVVRYTARVNRRGYTASKWVAAGRVAATAVNAIHISAGYDGAEDRGVVFSLLPRDFLAPPSDYQSFLSPDSSIYTDIPAGEAVFGGGEAPLVGNRVLLEGACGALDGLPLDYVPRQGDSLVILVERPERYPVAAVFENWEGGEVVLAYADGSREAVGWVIRPAHGVGRFAGSRYAGIGRIRANHAGVVGVSTSPLGELGAFQILPMGHALSPEMGIAWRMTQWMIVGPRGEESPLWGGLRPLFYQHLRPEYLPDDLYAPDWEPRLLARFLVEADFGNGWQPLPALRLDPDPTVPLPGWAHSGLAEARQFRILFPLAERSSSARRVGAGQ